MRVPSRSGWLIPDVALAAATVTLFYSLFLFAGYQKFFRDSDAGWHIRSGERILNSGSLPRLEPFSFTMQGRPWFAWEWAADVIMGTIHQNWGLSGVTFFYGCAIAAGVWLWFRLNWLVGGNFLLACLFAAPMLSTANLHWLARPHVLSWLFLLGAVMFAERLRVDPRLTVKRVVGIAVFSCFWANIHASFFLGAVIGLVYGAGLGLAHVIWRAGRGPTPYSGKPQMDSGGRDCATALGMDSAVGRPKAYPTWISATSNLRLLNEFGTWRVFVVASVISALATFVNPYGWTVHQHVLRYLSDSELLDRVGEFQSFNFHAPGTFQIMLAMGLAALGGALALTQRNLPVFFLTAIFVAAALRSARGLPLVALLLLPLANGVFTRALESARDLRLPIENFLAYSNRLRAFDARASGLVWAPLAALIALALLHTPAIAAATGFPPDQFPVAASAVIDTLPGDARILSPDKFGGYLIYRFDGRRKVFFDGRSDLYGADFLKQYGRMMQVRPGWQHMIDPYHFSHALLPYDSSLVPALEQAGWRELYHDSVCTLLSRN